MKKTEKESCRKGPGGRILYMAVLILVLGVFCFSAYQILKYVWEWTAGWKVTDDIRRKAVSETVLQTETETEKEYAPITVDFESLRRENKEIVAWIHCPDTVIDYPVVQAADNSYYLNRLVDGRINPAGTLFLDCRNASDFSDLNSIIYGHHMKNNTMFGTLEEYLEQAYYEEHPVMYLLTPGQDFKVELYLGYVTEDTAEVYALPMNEEYRARVLSSGLNRTTFSSAASLDNGDRLLTLSTCTYEYDDARYVVMGILRELDRP